LQVTASNTTLASFDYPPSDICRCPTIGIKKSASGRLRSMAGIVLYGGIIPRQQPIDLALFVTVDDGGVSSGQNPRDSGFE
jgi:hypothetical protein